jgi:MFS transporter, Spinster family, sphingosine-1-phosphate transporter
LAVSAAAPRLTRPWVVVALLMLVYTCGYIDRYALTIVLDQVKLSFQASDTYMGFLAGPAFALFFTLASLPVARLADRHSRVNILALGCATWSAFTLASAFAQTKLGFTIARLGVGLGEAACLAPAYSLLSDYFPPRRRALPVGFFNVSVYLGQITGLWLGGGLAAQMGWRRMYWYIGVPGLLIALLFRIIVREPRRGALDGAASVPGSATFLATARALFARPAFPRLVAGAALTTFAGMGFAYWAPVFFMRVHHMTRAQVGWQYGLVFGLSSMAGALLAGRLGNHLGQVRAGGALRIAAIAGPVTLAFMAAVCFTPGVVAALALLVPAGLANGAWLVPVQATLQDLVDAGSRATAAAVFACSSLLIGFLGPWAVGALSDAWSPRFGDDTLRYAIAAVLLVGLAGGYAFARAGHHAARA